MFVFLYLLYPSFYPIGYFSHVTDIKMLTENGERAIMFVEAGDWSNPADSLYLFYIYEDNHPSSYLMLKNPLYKRGYYEPEIWKYYDVMDISDNEVGFITSEEDGLYLRRYDFSGNELYSKRLVEDDIENTKIRGFKAVWFEEINEFMLIWFSEDTLKLMLYNKNGVPKFSKVISFSGIETQGVLSANALLLDDTFYIFWHQAGFNAVYSQKMNMNGKFLLSSPVWVVKGWNTGEFRLTMNKEKNIILISTYERTQCTNRSLERIWGPGGLREGTLIGFTRNEDGIYLLRMEYEKESHPQGVDYRERAYLMKADISNGEVMDTVEVFYTSHGYNYPLGDWGEELKNIHWLFNSQKDLCFFVTIYDWEEKDYTPYYKIYLTEQDSLLYTGLGKPVFTEKPKKNISILAIGEDGSGGADMLLRSGDSLFYSHMNKNELEGIKEESKSLCWESIEVLGDKIIVRGIGAYRVKIYDASGRMVYENRLMIRRRKKINVDFPPGIYFIVVEGKDRVFKHKLLNIK